ncbi:fibrillin [Leptolyngbya sp. 'hensonii']|uniref:PAP/fibrillin family protein n=1 Tax=Leptolyngbya sp. 'hensonii' TaxID=1922337 RepID=UPI00094FAB5D|nr:PAP/fibrillin family protein [Leptolyngbya sp. 'hensonii']OLP19098.1 fibrillin [Leptolyngbya sp. 'hensonii']
MLGKAELLEAIAGKNRGLLANATDRQAILAAIARLEDHNPNPQPFQSTDLLNGNWRLLYTTSQELLNLDRFPFLKLGQIYQCIRVPEAQIYNIAEVYGVPYLEGLVSVAARFQVISAQRVEVKFERAILGLQRFIGYASPQDLIHQIESGKRFTAIDFDIVNREQQGWLDITYLDQDLRIGRGNQGSVFVLTKVMV